LIASRACASLTRFSPRERRMKIAGRFRPMQRAFEEIGSRAGSSCSRPTPGSCISRQGNRRALSVCDPSGGDEPVGRHDPCDFPGQRIPQAARPRHGRRPGFGAASSIHCPRTPGVRRKCPSSSARRARRYHGSSHPVFHRSRTAGKRMDVEGQIFARRANDNRRVAA